MADRYCTECGCDHGRAYDPPIRCATCETSARCADEHAEAMAPLRRRVAELEHQLSDVGIGELCKKNDELQEATKALLDRLHEFQAANEGLAEEASEPWRILSRTTDGDRVVEVMAACSDDGIGVLASWRRVRGRWIVYAMDTESSSWEEVTDDDDIVPLTPPDSLLRIGSLPVSRRRSSYRDTAESGDTAPTLEAACAAADAVLGVERG